MSKLWVKLTDSHFERHEQMKRYTCSYMDVFIIVKICSPLK